MRLWVFVGALMLTMASGAQAGWVGSWAAAPQSSLPPPANFEDQTVRLIVHVSVGGAQLRVHLSNLYGDVPLVIGAAHVARRKDGAQVEGDTSLTFDGRGELTIPAHGEAVSDAVVMVVPPRSDLAVTLYFSDKALATTDHALALQTSYVAKGNALDAATFDVASTVQTWPFLTGVAVDAPDDDGALVVLGDSLTDGDGSTPDANHRVTDALAERLPDWGVLNEGIIGNRLLRDLPELSVPDVGHGMGEAALKRFDRDVLSQAGVRAVLVRLGINDIGEPGVLAAPSEAATAEDIEAGFKTLADSAHAHHLRFAIATLTPFEGSFYYSLEKDAVRETVNAWLRAQGRSGGIFDAVLDADLLLRDPAHPARLSPGFDKGDHLHTNDRGYALFAGAMPLSLVPKT